MKHQVIRHFGGRFVVAVTLGAMVLTGSGVCVAAAAESNPVLARVDLDKPVHEFALPIRAHLVDGAGQEYVVVVQPPSRLQQAGVAFRVLDAEIADSGYLIALERRPGGRQLARRSMPILLDDGLRVLVRGVPGRDDVLAEMGFDLARLSDRALVVRAPEEAPLLPQVTFDPAVQAMISQVQQSTVWDYTGDVTGENEVTIGGGPYTITTRNTRSGEPIEKATQFVYEFLLSHGVGAIYHYWTHSGDSGRNVIGEMQGILFPDEIVLITAHLDDMPSSGAAPGADDNASGSVAVMMAAEIMQAYTFKRTVRFVFFTGEEQGLKGADAYAGKVFADGDNIVAVYNMDMIAYDGTPGPVLEIHTRPGNTGDQAIATTFTHVVSTYGLSGVLTPNVLGSGISASDHAEFWARGYPAVLAIEDTSNDFNPWYHTSDDDRDILNMTYFTNYVRASVGTAAHLADPASGTVAIAPTGMSVVEQMGNENDLIEPGEMIRFIPTWSNVGTLTIPNVEGTVTTPDSIMVLSDGASYGSIAPGASSSCDSANNCYVFIANGGRPATHWDITFDETLNLGDEKTWWLHVGDSFVDVPADHWAYHHVETVLHNSVTAGCATDLYCPAQAVDRWQMGVFIAKSMLGDLAPPTTGTVPGKGDYVCSPGGMSVFADITPGDPACSSIHFIAAEGITAGCNATDYCPREIVDRWQMAVFMATAMIGDGTLPISGTVPGMGDYDCQAGGSSVFGDIDPEDPACPAVHYLAVTGVTAGCGSGLYCPSADVLRDQMAVFLTSAFALELYAP